MRITLDLNGIDLVVFIEYLKAKEKEIASEKDYQALKAVFKALVGRNAKK